MIVLFYGCVFAASLISASIYIYMWHKHFDVNFTLIFTLVPIACYLLSARAASLESAVTAVQITYIGGSFLQLFITFSIFDLCQAPLRKWIRTVLFLVCTCIYATTLTIGHTDLFYKSIAFDPSATVSTLTRGYGPMHVAHYHHERWDGSGYPEGLHPL